MVHGSQVAGKIVRSRSRELFLLTIIVLCLGIALLTSQRTVACPGRVHRRVGDLGVGIQPPGYGGSAAVSDSFNSLFFVSVGMLMDVRVVLEHPMLVIALVGAVLIGKFFTAAGPVLTAGQSPRTATGGDCAG